MGASTTIKVLIIDDIDAVRQGLRMRLTLEPDFIVVGEAASERTGLEAIPRLNPNLVLFDLNLPDVDSFATIAFIRQQYPDLVIVVLSIHDEIVLKKRALASGADAFVDKSSGVPTLLEEMRRAFTMRGNRHD